jgi:hypothetical protein
MSEWPTGGLAMPLGGRFAPPLAAILHSSGRRGSAHGPTEPRGLVFGDPLVARECLRERVDLLRLSGGEHRVSKTPRRARVDGAERPEQVISETVTYEIISRATLFGEGLVRGAGSFRRLAGDTRGYARRREREFAAFAFLLRGAQGFVTRRSQSEIRSRYAHWHRLRAVSAGTASKLSRSWFGGPKVVDNRVRFGPREQQLRECPAHSLANFTRTSCGDDIDVHRAIRWSRKCTRFP